MSTIITYDGGPTMTPLIAETRSYTAQASARTVTHEILDGPPVYTLRPAGADTGELTLIFADEVTALDCYTAHKLAAVFTITDTDRELLNLDYVVVDPGARITLDPQTQRRWIVTVPYREAS